MNDLTVNVTKTINAPIEAVFDAWLNPEMLTQFILPMRGMAQPQVENDPREGGTFSILMQVGDEQIPHTGTYLSIERPNKLIFSWVSPASSDDSVVTLIFNSQGANSTALELTHVRFIDEQRRANHEGGWRTILQMQSELMD